MGRRGHRHGGGAGMGGGRGSGMGMATHMAADMPLLPPPPPPPIDVHPPVKGPYPGVVSVACQYTQEQQLRRMQRDKGCDPSREDSYRLQGVQLIDNVRESLQLPVKTFTTACTYYHKFRLSFRDAEYNFQDAALSALFVACKVEDTIKKSKEVLCAAYNLKNADKPTAPDDKIFERPSTIIVGLDRLILQTVGFDFRVRHPQKLLIKMIRRLIPPEDAKEFLAVAYPMSIDLYKTFAPIKQTSFTMALSVIELTALVLGKHVEAIRALDAEAFHTSRGCIVETLLDLLDLYTQFTKATKIGPRFKLDRFIEIKIRINEEVDAGPQLVRIESWCDKCAAEERDTNPMTPKSATSPATTGSGPGGSKTKAAGPKRQETTMRFVFSDEAMRHEQSEMAKYFAEEYEEFEAEVEESGCLSLSCNSLSDGMMGVLSTVSFVLVAPFKGPLGGEVRVIL
ncbi:c-type cyclin [Grosmannia clavigera kw1407]|uniref:RNA polymerase II holoenzyme cyclin-like subunit n=1 Tax=Grosmannia clavigera (strain kw1407 / UAMH 11150) TaxID=655863 RepID=F0X854_GROCL|nr:c-type cyclin [Grosmannia clavigera kw1407]EFX05247.1 c-type cyclin [Grosmannia clavigera kw1407]